MVVCDAVGGVFGFIVDVSNYAQITIFLIKKGGFRSKTCRAIVNIFD